MDPDDPTRALQGSWADSCFLGVLTKLHLTPKYFNFLGFMASLIRYIYIEFHVNNIR